MNIVESTIVTVLNYSDSFASFPTQIKPDGYLFEPALNDEQPFAIPISFSEIRVANSQSNIFREGVLRFEPEVEQEIYEKLGIRDWEQILSDNDIRNILLKPTKAGLEKIVKVTSSSLLERVRGMLIMLENTGMYDISIRVKDVVNKRYQELYNNQRKSDIVITATASEQAAESVDLDKIKEEVEAKVRAEFELEQEKLKIKEEELNKFRESIRAELEAEYKEKLNAEKSKLAQTKQTQAKPQNKRQPQTQK